MIEHLGWKIWHRTTADQVYIILVLCAECGLITSGGHFGFPYLLGVLSCTMAHLSGAHLTFFGVYVLYVICIYVFACVYMCICALA